MELARHIADILSWNHHQEKSVPNSKILETSQSPAPLEAAKTPDEVRNEMNERARIMATGS